MTKKLTGSEKEMLPKEVSLKEHLGVTAFKGSSYNGKGNVDKSKVRSNKKRKQ